MFGFSNGNVTALLIEIDTNSSIANPSSLNVGPAECSRSYFGQQTRHEGLDDGCRDLTVPHTWLHHNTLMACPSLLCPDRRRVSLTHLTLSLSLCHNHVWVSSSNIFTNTNGCWNNHLLFPFTLPQLTCQSGLDEITSCCELECIPVDETSSNWATLKGTAKATVCGIFYSVLGKVLWTWHLW